MTTWPGSNESMAFGVSRRYSLVNGAPPLSSSYVCRADLMKSRKARSGGGTSRRPE